jgi:hypothetical protein
MSPRLVCTLEIAVATILALMLWPFMSSREAARQGAQVYYVSPTATNAGDGMNVLTPTRPETALAKADVGTIVFLPGTYWRDRSLGVITKNVNLVARGPGVVLTGWQNPATVNWSLHGGQIWKAARSTVQLVADAKPGVRTAWGDYPVYVQQPTLAKVLYSSRMSTSSWV